MLKQVSVFAENKKGTLQTMIGALSGEQINILGSVTNDSAEYGIVRMVVSEPEKALEILHRKGYQARLTDVLGVEVEDRPGELNRLLLEIREGNIDVNYLYLSFNRDTGKPIMVLHTEDIMEAQQGLAARGFCML